jgi:fused signal recognition particle receptor
MGLFKFLKEKFSHKKDGESSLNETKIQNNEESLDKIKNKELTDENNKELAKYDKGLEKSRKEFADKLHSLSKKYRKVNDEYFHELEEVLIEADVGVSLTLSVINELLEVAKTKKISDTNVLNEELIDLLFAKYLHENEVLKTDFDFEEGKTTVGLIVGVNGVGKTTTIAKLAFRYMNQGKKVLLIAGDTFRAGAVDQLKIWAERLKCDIVSGQENQDPASVVFDGCKKAAKAGYDLILVDTAGRLQTKQNLMNELVKIDKVIAKAIPDSKVERLLILDATTGQNGVIQAKAFFEATTLDGIVITKMDGTSKGGIILSIKTELNIPVRFIGLGEKLTDLEPFDLEKYLYSLCVPSEDK